MKTAVVTGASGGLGIALCKAWVSSYWNSSGCCIVGVSLS